MRVHDAVGGTNRAGVPAKRFEMPEGMRIRYDLPHPRLAHAVTAYAIYISDDRTPLTNWYLPGQAMISILLDAGPVSVTIRNRTYPSIPQASLYGPTSYAPRTLTHGGIMVGIGLTATGWAQLTARSASRLLNHVEPLSDTVGLAKQAELVGALEALPSDAHIAPLLDELLPGMLGQPSPSADRLNALAMRTLTDGIISTEQVAKMLDLQGHTLRRLSSTAFGLPPKALLSRARFIRSMSRWLLGGEPASYLGMDSSYFDTSHFLRDANIYLGTTPIRFAKRETAYLRASLQARQAVAGAPAHVLHRSIA